MAVHAAPWKTGDPYQEMQGTIFDYVACWTIRTIAEFSIADHLAAGSRTVDEVAELTATPPGTMLRLLRAGVAVGLVTEEADGRFASTPLLMTLRSDDPRSLRALVLSLVSGWQPWDHFADAIRSGSYAFVKAYDGVEIFDYLAAHPEEAKLFSDGMTSMTSPWGSQIASKIDTTGVRCAVDVGGANGTLLQLLQRDNPSLHGIVFDRPNVVDHANAAIKSSGLQDRTRTVGGSFFESIPEGDLLLLKFILHDWSDGECVTILQRCREALTAGGRIMIVELIVDNANPHAALADMLMLLSCSGRERSIEEFDGLFAAAGLRRIAVHDTGTPQSVIELGLAEAG
jgi:hypothetical protein